MDDGHTEFEEQVADKCSGGVEDDIVDVYGAEGVLENERHDKLDELKATADGKNDPGCMFWFNGNEKREEKTKRHRE